MITLSSQIKTMPIVSLQTGGTVAWINEPIIDASKLEVAAYLCDGAPGRRKLVLMATAVRQMAADCVIVDSEDELTNPEDIVRMRSILDASYNPLNKHVVSDTGRRLGNVDDYSINLQTARVQKLHVRQSLFKSWLGASLIIDRTQIIDIAPRQITVRDAAAKAPIMHSEPVPDSSP